MRAEKVEKIKQRMDLLKQTKIKKIKKNLLTFKPSSITH